MFKGQELLYKKKEELTNKELIAVGAFYDYAAANMALRSIFKTGPKVLAITLSLYFMGVGINYLSENTNLGKKFSQLERQISNSESAKAFGEASKAISYSR